MEMTPRRRLLAAIRGEEVDHVPFSPFLAYYFESLPAAVQQRGQLAYLQEMGADPLLRGMFAPYTVHFRSCGFTSRTEGGRRYDTFTTPHGELHQEYTYAPRADSWFLTRHMAESAQQLPAVLDLYNDLVIEENIRETNARIAQLGEDGLYLPLIATHGKTAYQFLLEHIAGTENLIYLTMDEPDLLQELLEVMMRRNRETVEIAAETDQEVFLTWEDSSTTNVSPDLYARYIQPEITSWCRMLKEAGKLYVQHACGHIRHLLPLMAEEGVAAVESISPEPTGNIRMPDVFASLPERVSLIGGIEPTQLLNSSVPELLDYAEMLIRTRGSRGYILANSDSCPPGVAYEKFTALARLVKDLG